MTDDVEPTRGAPSGRPEWEQPLDDLERSLRDAAQAVAHLRQALNGGAGEPQFEDRAQAAAQTQDIATDGTDIGPREDPSPVAASRPNTGKAGASTFDDLWDRIEREKMEKPAPEATERRGLDLLPQQVLMTVEDREGRVDLVPLHRGLAGLQGIQDISLVSYANGVPVISLRVEGDLDIEQLGTAAGRAMDRQCEVIQQDTGRLYLRLKGCQHEDGNDA
jgi:hypothetical protein